MKYYVIQITTNSVGTATMITEKTSIDEAKMLYHQILASVYADKDVSYALVMIVNDLGFCEVMERVPTAPAEE